MFCVVLLLLSEFIAYIAEITYLEIVMGSHFLKILFAVLVSLLGFNWPAQSSHVKCIEKERQALLNFKQGLIDHSSMLSTWRDDDSNKVAAIGEALNATMKQVTYKYSIFTVRIRIF